MRTNYQPEKEFCRQKLKIVPIYDTVVLMRELELIKSLESDNRDSNFWPSTSKKR